jgi:hypothetical protein
MLFNDAEIQSTRQKKSDPDYVDVVVGLIDSRLLWEDGVCSKVRNEIYGTEIRRERLHLFRAPLCQGSSL